MRRHQQRAIPATNRLSNLRGEMAVQCAIVVSTYCDYQIVRSSSHDRQAAAGTEAIGGRTRTRTLDPLIKSQLLYQLSYAP
jgi:hypothetical protein